MSVQGSAEWLAERCGSVTASRFSDVLAKIKSGESASRRNYRAEIVCERLTKTPADHFETAEMRRGTEQEPHARMAYEAMTGSFVVEQGFIKHPTIAWCGASPDGFIGDDGGIEIKCPNTAQHIDALLKGMDSDHIAQVQGNLWVSGRRWWDFISYDSRLPEHLQLYVQRVNRDDTYIAKMEAEVKAFLAEVDELLAKLSKLGVKDLRKAA